MVARNWKSFCLEHLGARTANSARVKWSLFLSLLLALVLNPDPARASLHDVPRMGLSGRSWVRVRDWAVSRGLRAEWLVRDRTLELAGGFNRVLITLDSAEILFNGTGVFLSHPVAARDGALCISELDAATVLAPLLRPPSLGAGKHIRTICLDPGHGGKDPGNQEGTGQEKMYTLLLAQELRAQLTKLGFNVVLTRAKDSFVDLEERPALARQRGADLFISLHFNATPTGKNAVRGAETFCLTPAGASSTNSRGAGANSGSVRGNANDDANLWLAYQIQKSLRLSLGTEDRGVRRARFAVLREAAMPAVLVEAGFLSHPGEGKKIGTAAYRKQIASAIADAVLAYRKSVERL
jgi:N-acetylmuramoyl-L-alanine amidase